MPCSVSVPGNTAHGSGRSPINGVLLRQLAPAGELEQLAERWTKSIREGRPSKVEETELFSRSHWTASEVDHGQTKLAGG